MSAADQQTADEVLRWRHAERQRLLALRATLSAPDRQRAADAIEAGLDQALGELRGRVVAVYWPIKGEPNLRRWMGRVHARGAMCALPVVTQRAAPVAFHAWWPGAAMARGFWGIPVPAEARAVRPDVVIAPMVGHDAQGYRLGYGGGYYDRTLAALSPRPLVVGVAYAASFLPTIHPLGHDIPMDVVVTEAGIVRDG